MSLNSILVQTLNGLSFGALLFLLASGFTLVFGLMRIVNLAHGALYLVGGYVGIVTAVGTGNFLLALVAGAAAAAVLGLLTERVLLRKVRGMELPEVLLTVGIALVIADVALAIFGGNPQSLSPPQWLSGALDLGFIAYPRYRWFVIGLAAPGTTRAIDRRPSTRDPSVRFGGRRGSSAGDRGSRSPLRRCDRRGWSQPGSGT